MTTEELNRALREDLTIFYNGAEYKLEYVKTWYERRGSNKGMRNTLHLIPCNGANSTTDALMRYCELKNKMPKGKEEI